MVIRVRDVLDVSLNALIMCVAGWQSDEAVGTALRLGYSSEGILGGYQQDRRCGVNQEIFGGHRLRWGDVNPSAHAILGTTNGFRYSRCANACACCAKSPTNRSRFGSKVSPAPRVAGVTPRSTPFWPRYSR